MILTYLLVISFFRQAVRNNNPNALLVGQKKFSSIFFARNHPLYQKITTYALYLPCVMPNDILSLSYKYLAVSNTGTEGNYQRGDACVEEINKKVKQRASQVSVPTKKEGLKTSQDLDNLEEVSSI